MCFRGKTKLVKHPVLIIFGINANIKKEKVRAVNEMRSGRETPLFLQEN